MLIGGGDPNGCVAQRTVTMIVHCDPSMPRTMLVSAYVDKKIVFRTINTVSFTSQL